MSDRNLLNVPKPAFTVVDLFAGCGGLTLGFHNTGFTSVAAVEHNRFAAATYRENFPNTSIHCGDIEEWALMDPLPVADVVIGGPPCQGFSNLNRKSKNEPDDRNSLWSTYVDVVARIRPKVFLLENVDRFFRSNELAMLRLEEEGGRLANYRIRSAVVRATDFGAAQLRKRTIVIGTREDLPTLEVPTGNGLPAKTVRAVLSRIKRQIPSWKVDLPHGRYAELPEGIMQGPFKTHELHLTRNYEAKSIERFQAIPEGGNRFDLPDRLKSPCWIKHESGAADVMGRLRWDRPSVTIRTEFFKPEKGRYLHPTEHRALTHREAALLQGFPDEFSWYGSKVEIARQIGNAVPVQLAEGLAQCIKGHLTQHLDQRHILEYSIRPPLQQARLRKATSSSITTR